MKCPKCGNEIEEGVISCPLCGEVLLDVPRKKKREGNRKIPFSHIYILLTLLLTLVCVCLNLFFKKSVTWWIIVAVSFAFLYFIIRHTLFGLRNTSSKIAYLSLALMLWAISIFEITAFDGGYTLVLPILQLIPLAIVLLRLFICFDRAKGYVTGVEACGVFASVPLWICLGKNICSTLAITSAVIGLTASTVVFIIFFKETLLEIKRFFRT